MVPGGGQQSEAGGASAPRCTPPPGLLAGAACHRPLCPELGCTWGSGVPGPRPPAPGREGQPRPPGVLGAAGGSEAQAKGCVGPRGWRHQPGPPPANSPRLEAQSPERTGSTQGQVTRGNHSAGSGGARCAQWPRGPRRACLAVGSSSLWSALQSRTWPQEGPPTPPRPCAPTQGLGREAHVGLGPGPLAAATGGQRAL